MTTPLFLLRSVEIGISISDLDLLTVGLVIDMWTEKANDGVKYNKIATQDDLINSDSSIRKIMLLCYCIISV